MWFISGRAKALKSVNRPLPHPRSTTTGASRPNSVTQSSGPPGGNRFRAVRAHSDSGRIRPGIGTPNSSSTSPGTGIGATLDVGTFRQILRTRPGRPGSGFVPSGGPVRAVFGSRVGEDVGAVVAAVEGVVDQALVDRSRQSCPGPILGLRGGSGKGKMNRHRFPMLTPVPGFPT